MSPKIIPWYGSQASKVQFEIVNRYGSVRYTAVVEKTINCLNWFLDNLKRDSPGNPDNHREFLGDKNLNLNIANNIEHMICVKEVFW